MKRIKRVGILTAGGDCPGLNAAIRGVGKAMLGRFGIEALGIRDGFLGLIENRMLPLDKASLAGILTVGGTIWEPAASSRTASNATAACATCATRSSGIANGTDWTPSCASAETARRRMRSASSRKVFRSLRCRRQSTTTSR